VGCVERDNVGWWVEPVDAALHLCGLQVRKPRKGGAKGGVLVLASAEVVPRDANACQVGVRGDGVRGGSASRVRAELEVSIAKGTNRRGGATLGSGSARTEEVERQKVCCIR